MALQETGSALPVLLLQVPTCAWYLLGGKQLLGVGWPGEPYPEKPALIVRFAVHQPGVLHHRVVHFDHLTGDGRVNVAGRLDRLDDGAGFAGLNLSAFLRQFHKHDVGQFMLRMIGNANRRRVTAHPHPFMGFGVFQVRRDLAHIRSLPCCVRNPGRFVKPVCGRSVWAQAPPRPAFPDFNLDGRAHPWPGHSARSPSRFPHRARDSASRSPLPPPASRRRPESGSADAAGPLWGPL